MPHTIEQAPTGRAKCRACGELIPAKTLRFGERVPNPYDDKGGDTTYWYHVPCAAFTRPESFLSVAGSTTGTIENSDVLSDEAKLGVAHRRLERARAAERAPTGRATCRQCRELIAKDEWRIALAFYEDGRFSPSGYVHLTCVMPYFETTAILPRVKHFSPGLTDADLMEIRGQLEEIGDR